MPQAAGSVPVVVIPVRDNGPFCRGAGAVAFLPDRATNGQTQILCPGEPFYEIANSIRTVVYDDEFFRRIVLPAERLQGKLNERPAIECWHDAGNQRRLWRALLRTPCGEKPWPFVA